MLKVIRIGRSPENEIRIDNPSVSRNHCQIRINSDVLTLEDLKSTNGTFVNGHKVNFARICSTDTISLGNNVNLDWSEINHLIGVKPVSKLESISIGRDPSNAFQIDNKRISRKHAVLSQKNGHWEIKDLNSLNGVFVNGQLVKKQFVDLNDEVSFAGISYKIRDILSNQQPQNDILVANNVSYAIKDKKLIDNISFSAPKGSFIGIIGESGSGKTTLLTLLNGYLQPDNGNILINSIPSIGSTEELKGVIGYVPQEDIIHKELTVRESLQFTARLRFENKENNFDLSKRVDYILEMLNLTESQNTIIGSSEKKGISGGQRKRVNLGQELISEPDILFLDEPTSGLDSRSEREVMELLADLSKSGKTILLTTHNVSIENIKMMTDLIVLANGGKLAYFGKAESACKYFGVSEPLQIFDKLKTQSPDSWKEQFAKRSLTEKKSVPQSVRKRLVEHKESQLTFNLSQFSTLVHRNILLKSRDIISSMILLVQAPIIAILIALVFSRPDQIKEAIFVTIIAAIWLGCSNSAREIVSEQAILKRERKVGMNLLSYLLSKYFILSLLCIIQSVTLIATSSCFIQFENPILLFLLICLTSLSSLSLGIFISSLSKTNETAIALVPIILIPKVVLGGFISIFARMPDFVRLLSGFSISRWAFEASLINQYADKQIISAIGFDPNNMVIDIAVIAMFLMIFMIASGIVLKRKFI